MRIIFSTILSKERGFFVKLIDLAQIRCENKWSYLFKFGSMTRAIIAIDYRPFFHASKMPVSFDDKKRSHISKIDYMPFGIKLLAYQWMWMPTLNTLKMWIQLSAHYFQEINWQLTHQISCLPLQNCLNFIQKYFNENYANPVKNYGLSDLFD